MKGGGVVQDCTHVDTGLLEGRGKWNRQKSLLAIVGKEQITAATKLKMFDSSWHCLLMLPLPSTQLVRLLGHHCSIALMVVCGSTNYVC